MFLTAQYIAVFAIMYNTYSFLPISFLTEKPIIGIFHEYSIDYEDRTGEVKYINLIVLCNKSYLKLPFNIKLSELGQ